MPINFIDFSRTDIEIKPPSLMFVSETYNRPYFYNTCDNTSSWEDKKLECSPNIPFGWKLVKSTKKYPGNTYFTKGTKSQWEIPYEKIYTIEELNKIINDIYTYDDDKHEEFITNLPTESQLTLQQAREIYENAEEIHILPPQAYNKLIQFDKYDFMYSDMENNDERHFGLFYSLQGDDKAVSGSGADDWYKLDKSLYDHIVKFKE